MVIQFSSLFIYMLTWQPKGHAWAKKETDTHIQTQKTKQGNMYHLDI
jgi:hypothetical protein